MSVLSGAAILATDPPQISRRRGLGLGALAGAGGGLAGGALAGAWGYGLLLAWSVAIRAAAGWDAWLLPHVLAFVFGFAVFGGLCGASVGTVAGAIGGVLARGGLTRSGLAPAWRRAFALIGAVLGTTLVAIAFAFALHGLPAASLAYGALIGFLPGVVGARLACRIAVRMTHSL